MFFSTTIEIYDFLHRSSVAFHTVRFLISNSPRTSQEFYWKSTNSLYRTVSIYHRALSDGAKKISFLVVCLLYSWYDVATLSYQLTRTSGSGHMIYYLLAEPSQVTSVACLCSDLVPIQSYISFNSFRKVIYNYCKCPSFEIRLFYSFYSSSLFILILEMHLLYYTTVHYHQ